jgi:hypothetical protein
MVTELQKRTAQAIINIFETGRLRGDYGNVTVARNDAGHLTYGRSQTTLASGNLFLLIRAYVDAPGADFAEALRPYLPRLEARDFTLDGDATLRQTLRQAGDDVVCVTCRTGSSIASTGCRPPSARAPSGSPRRWARPSSMTARCTRRATVW